MEKIDQYWLENPGHEDEDGLIWPTQKAIDALPSVINLLETLKIARMRPVINGEGGIIIRCQAKTLHWDKRNPTKSEFVDGGIFSVEIDEDGEIEQSNFRVERKTHWLDELE